jgi:4-hydroxybenzoate polyprenyltransferase
MLFVDLDNTLIKSDYFLESFVKYFSQNIFAPFICIYIFARTDKVGLKKFLYEKSNISIENLPYNKDVIDAINDWKKDHPNEKVFLISATFHKAVESIAKHLKYFDGWYGTENKNLKSEFKLKKIKDLTDGKDFAYIGDSFADLVIWENAKKCFLVNPTKNLLKEVRKINPSIKVIENKDILTFSEIIQTIRVHQWVKNLLLFVPAILSLKPFIDLLENLISGFLSFSLIASAFYILNDLFDIENDRAHHSKKFRSFASGSLSIPYGFYIFSLLVIIALIISINLSQTFQFLLFLYASTSFLYSKYLKKIPILDIFILSSLYLLRVIAGGTLAGITISNWLLTFSVFFFLYLASIKRWIELKRLNSETPLGRGYQNSDLPFVSNLSYFSGLISVLVICLYIESQQALTLYNDSKLLWLIPVILLYWILETLFMVQRDQIDDDPVKYALKSVTSYISVLGFVIILLIAGSI